LALNPNGRIPALVDHKRNDFVVWESGAVLLYLVKHYDTENRLWSTDADEQSHILEWLFFQVSGFGPYIGQGFWYFSNCCSPSHPRFMYYHSEKIPSAVERYTNEAKRMYGVLESQLQKPESKGYLAAGKYTIADLSFIAWALLSMKLKISLADYPAVEKWYNTISSRPATLAGFKGGPYERKD
jgi:glutathione S-transferase